MARRVYADADGASYEQISGRREQDRAFLAWLRACTDLRELAAMRRDRRLPAWRRIAVDRRIKQLVMG